MIFDIRILRESVNWCCIVNKNIINITLTHVSIFKVDSDRMLPKILIKSLPNNKYNEIYLLFIAIGKLGNEVN